MPVAHLGRKLWPYIYAKHMGTKRPPWENPREPWVPHPEERPWKTLPGRGGTSYVAQDSYTIPRGWLSEKGSTTDLNAKTTRHRSGCWRYIDKTQRVVPSL